MAEETFDFRASITELQAVLLGTEGIDGFLQEMAVLAAREVGQGLSCGITLQPNGRPLTVASSDANAAQTDELQYGLDHGPCLTALRTGTLVRIDDLATDQRWRDYAVRALAHGVRSSLSMPLTTPDGPVGALNLYSSRPHFFGQAETRLAERFAQDATVAVGIAARLAAQSVLAGQLRDSLASRAVIDQAIGVIMAQQAGCARAARCCRSHHHRRPRQRNPLVVAPRAKGRNGPGHMLGRRSEIRLPVKNKAAVLVQWAQMIADSTSVQPLALRLCVACVRLVGADGAAITLACTRPERLTLCATDQTAARLEDLQDVTGQGPGPDAYRTGVAVITSLGRSAAARWPLFAQPALAAIGQGRLCSLPIRPDSEVLGVLTFYQTGRRPLHYELDEIQFLANALGVALLQDPASHAEIKTGPWTSRAQVHHATGMVIAQLGIPPEDALALLRAHAYAHATSLNDIAAQVTSRQLDFSLTDNGTDTDTDGNETS